MARDDMSAEVNRRDPEYVAQVISDYINGMGHNRKPFIAKLLAQHRTLQSQTVELFMDFLKAMGELPENQQDPRNQYAVKAAKAGYAAMVEALNGATRLPFI